MENSYNINAQFLISSPSIKTAPNPDLTEVVFLGRSNVGKSSLINALCERKGLAKSSSTPGKTRLLNFFNVKLSKNDIELNLRLVDLPGFGFAKVSHKEKEEWEKNLTSFLQERASIRAFIHLVDSRHPDLEIDHNVANFLLAIKRGDQKIFTVFTKFDKLKANEKNKLKNNYKDGVFVSSEKKTGIVEFRDSVITYLFGDVFAN